MFIWLIRLCGFLPGFVGLYTRAPFTLLRSAARIRQAAGIHDCMFHITGFAHGATFTHPVPSTLVQAVKRNGSRLSYSTHIEHRLTLKKQAKPNAMN